MEITNLFISKITFVFEIIGALYLFASKSKLKRYPWLRIPGAITISVLVATFFPIFESFSYTWYGTSIMYLIIFMVTALLLKLVYNMSWLKWFFVSVISYTSQHMLYQVSSIILLVFGLADKVGSGYDSGLFLSTDTAIIISRFCVIATIYVLGYAIINATIASKIFAQQIKVKQITLISISAIALFADIILCTMAIYQPGKSYMTSILIASYDFVSCLTILLLLFYILRSKTLEQDLLVSDMLLNKAEEKYEQSKQNMDLINIKCHDLKHQIRNYSKNASIDKETLKDIANTINIYDKTMHTNNEAIDLILMEKALYCQKESINLKCYADCSKLNFVSNSDLYSLFGNAIDNSIEAVKKIEDIEKRNINIIIRYSKGFISIRIENYYNTLILGHDGMPKTTKGDNSYHGFGLKSIKMIVDKYDGNLKINTDNNVFSLSIMLPIPPQYKDK